MRNGTDFAKRQARMAAINRLIGDLGVHLKAQGFYVYKTHEWLHPSGRHVRKNYASGEWVLVVSDMHGTNYTPVETIRFDSRLSSLVLPEPGELAARVAPAQ